MDTNPPSPHPVLGCSYQIYIFFPNITVHNSAPCLVHFLIIWLMISHSAGCLLRSPQRSSAQKPIRVLRSHIPASHLPSSHLKAPRDAPGSELLVFFSAAPSQRGNKTTTTANQRAGFSSASLGVVVEVGVGGAEAASGPGLRRRGGRNTRGLRDVRRWLCEAAREAEDCVTR